MTAVGGAHPPHTVIQSCRGHASGIEGGTQFTPQLGSGLRLRGARDCSPPFVLFPRYASDWTSERLRAVVHDIGFCARLGGDEFTVVVERVDSQADIERAAERLVEGFQEPLVVEGRELLMGLSLGASLFPVHGRDPEGLLRAAMANWR